MTRKLSVEVLYDTEHYEVVVGESTDPDNPGPCYHIVNKNTGVPEVESKIYPNAIGICNEINKAHDEPIEKAKENSNVISAFQH